MTATLAALVFIPLIFIKGKAADLPRGTVFDAYTKTSTTVTLDDGGVPRQTIDLSNKVGPRLEVEILYDELSASEKPNHFYFAIKAPVEATGEFFIDTVNGKKIEALALETEASNVTEGIQNLRAKIDIKKLGKEFKKGINSFEVGTVLDGERLAKEVVLDIQF